MVGPIHLGFPSSDPELPSYGFESPDKASIQKDSQAPLGVSKRHYYLAAQGTAGWKRFSPIVSGQDRLPRERQSVYPAFLVQRLKA